MIIPEPFNHILVESTGSATLTSLIIKIRITMTSLSLKRPYKTSIFIITAKALLMLIKVHTANIINYYGLIRFIVNLTTLKVLVNNVKIVTRDVDGYALKAI